MAISKDAEVAALQARLTVIDAALGVVITSGQSFRKGGSQGFATEQAKLSELRKERSEITAKLALWGVYDA